jgi:hypothetical protein
MIENWDNYEPFQILMKQDFVFQPSRYEIWIAGKMIENGMCTSEVICTIIEENDEEKAYISFDEINLKNEIISKMIFDEMITATDRIQIATVPEISNDELPYFNIFKTMIGATRSHKIFSSKEPYCCNIFQKNGIIAKITFSFGFPEKLIELYQ